MVSPKTIHKRKSSEESPGWGEAIINCPSCNAENRDQANFCLACGGLLLEYCPRCSFEVQHGSTFCDNCGLKLQPDWDVAWWAGETSQVQRSHEARAQRPKSKAAPDISAFTPVPQSQTIPSAGPQPSRRVPAATQADGSASSIQKYIPKELEAKLTAARVSGEMVGERRVVTMLFCDVKGSTAAAEHMDPEDWGEIINGAFEYMIKPVYQYEGIVARMMGDGLLAFFGAPIAHEDDPQRAILAGLEIVAAIRPYREQVQGSHGIDFDVRVGINTGLVVVGSVGSDLRMEYTALGDAINLASRMEATAVPGTVQISHDTFKLVKPLFDFEELGGIEVKGKSEPVPAYRVLGKKEEAARTRGIEGLHAEMVGREIELESLRNLLTNLKQGVGHIACVLGDAGVGKSRLINEACQVFEVEIGDEGDWHETLTLSYETNQAYGMFQRLLRRILRIPYDESPAVLHEGLVSLVDTLPEERRPRALQVLEALFGLDSDGNGVPMEGETFKRELYEAIHTWWSTRFSERPTVVVFDDMHWSDSASIELLLQLLPLTEEIPLVLLCAMRGERSSPAWQVKTAADEIYHHRYTELSLRSLTREESSELVSRLLAIAEISDSIREGILEKSAGNPFFIEEVVRALIENGAVIPEDRSVNGKVERYWMSTSEGAEFAIPDNLRSLLSARMDRLEDETRATLQMASVIGRNFYRRVLDAVNDGSTDVDKNVGALMRMDMIREAARVPEVEYTFRNPLTQEAVYKTILLKRRREFHRRVGDAMVELYPDRLEGLYGLLAHHFALAGDRDKAIEYSRNESGQAVALYAYDDAIMNLRAALELIDPEDQSEIHLTLHEELADVYCLLRDGDRAIGAYQRALEIWSGVEGADEITAVRLDRKIVGVITDLKWSVSLEHLQGAEEARQGSLAGLNKALIAMEDGQAHVETVRALVTLSTDAWRIQEPADWDAAQRYAQAAVNMAQGLDSSVDLSQAHGALANVLDGRSRLLDHLETAEKRLEITRQPDFDDLRENLDALRGVGAARMYVGEYQQALPFLEEAEEIATRIQATEQIANALGLQAQCLFRMDRWDDVLAIETKWRDLEGRHTRERVGET
jgi:class 3 adenylate cyclase/tetratricopeptide (TPR) repeat protein